MHCSSNFPLRKESPSLDLSLLKGTTDSEYLHQLSSSLPSILEPFQPELVIYDSGVDIHEKDKLGKLKISSDGIYKRDLKVLAKKDSFSYCCRWWL